MAGADVLSRIAAALNAPDALRAWLRERPPTMVVGVPTSSRSCMLALWLTDVADAPIRVGVRQTFLGESCERLTDLPLWAQRAVDYYDRHAPCEVLPAKCLRIVDDAEVAARLEEGASLSREVEP